ncbi:MAG: hypothetical protein HKP61_12320 [Dactylosporangium sp.]|nr:hypothetical protein [Dactylosporangium sp.]NNJ61704.1 hypothetical protein [Dactylosporangium sp.]
MVSTDPVASGDLGGAPLKVYPPGLDRAAGLVEDSGNNNFVPAVRGVFEAYRGGTPFGSRTLSPVLAQARLLHHDCLVQSGETLSTYVWASSVLVEAVRQVKANYSEADRSSAERSKAITTLLTDAVTAAQAQARAQANQEARAASDAQAYGSGYAANPQDGSGV